MGGDEFLSKSFLACTEYHYVKAFFVNGIRCRWESDMEYNC